MHVLIVSEYCRPWPGGISEHVHAEALGLAARGHRVTVLSGPGATVPSPVSVVALPHAVHFGSNGAASRLSLGTCLLHHRALLRELRPDVIHVHAPFDPVLPLLTVLSSEVPVVGTFHASFTASAGWALLYHRTLPWIAAAALRLKHRIAVSAEAERSARQYMAGHFERVPNGVDLARFSPHAKRDPVVLFVGRPDARKGLHLLLDAFSSSQTSFHLHVAGPVPLSMRRRHPSVVFHGYVAPDVLPSLMGRASVVCAPSLGSESQGIVLLEAMASGATVIASDIAGYREVVTHGVDGLLVAPGDVESLRDALAVACTDADLRARLCAAARERVKAYDWPLVVARIEHVLAQAARSQQDEGSGRAVF